MRRISWSLLIIAALIAPATVEAQGPGKAEELRAKGIDGWRPGMGRGRGPIYGSVPSRFTGSMPPSYQRTPTGLTGTLQYDSGTINALPTIFGQVYGNRFNENNSGAPLTGTITANSFSFYFMEDSLPDTGLFFQPAVPVGGATINALASINIGGLANSGPSFSNPALNTRSWGVLGVANTFNPADVFLGAWCLNSNANFPVNNETLGLDTTPGGAGLQGYTADSGTGNQPFSAQAFNAVLRVTATGPNVPVELMSFEAE